MKLFFRKYGEGPPLIILHGLFGTSDNWNTLAKKYGESFTTYIVDLRNHGQSPHSNEWNYQVMADDVIELMNDESIHSAYVLGHSMGGKVAMFMAGKYPKRIDKLIISDISPGYYPPHHTEIIEALQVLNLETTLSRKDAEQYMELKIVDFGVRQFLLKNLFWNNGKLAWRFNLNVIAEQIENVGEPVPSEFVFHGDVLFVRGSKSTYITDKDFDLIQSHFPNAKIETINGAGHWIHAEKPIEFLELTRKFIQ